MSTQNALRYLSEQDFAGLGLDQVAFFLPVSSDGEVVFEIRDAHGETIGQAVDRDQAISAIFESGLCAVWLN